MIFICGHSDAVVQAATYSCKFCTDKGIPEGYNERHEWGFEKVKKEKQIKCPDCGRYAFKCQIKKPHGACSIETNRKRKELKRLFNTL